MTLALLTPSVPVILIAFRISSDFTGKCSVVYFKVNKQRLFCASHPFGKLWFHVLHLSWQAQSRVHHFLLHRAGAPTDRHLIPPTEGGGLKARKSPAHWAGYEPRFWVISRDLAGQLLLQNKLLKHRTPLTFPSRITLAWWFISYGT